MFSRVIIPHKHYTGQNGHFSLSERVYYCSVMFCPVLSCKEDKLHPGGAIPLGRICERVYTFSTLAEMSFSLAGVPVKALVDFVDFNGLIHDT